MTDATCFPAQKKHPLNKSENLAKSSTQDILSGLAQPNHMPISRT
jgi:hypothetical protein